MAGAVDPVEELESGEAVRRALRDVVVDAWHAEAPGRALEQLDEVLDVFGIRKRPCGCPGDE